LCSKIGSHIRPMRAPSKPRQHARVTPNPLGDFGRGIIREPS
jgi:hypothetical protein